MGAADSTERAKPAASESRHPGFSLLLYRFHATLEALLDVLEAISESVAALDNSGYSQEIRFRFEVGEEARFRKFLEKWGTPGPAAEGDAEHGPEFPLERPPSVDRAPRADPSLAENAPRERNAPSEGSSVDEGLSKIGDGAIHEASEEEIRAQLEDALQPENLEQLRSALSRASERPKRTSILNGSLLAMAVGALETLLAGIATQHYLLHPGAIGDEKEFSLFDLQSFESVEDASDLAISRRVDNLMRGGIDDWSRWFAKVGCPAFDDLAPSYEVVHEAIQRRHLVVHNAGRVDRQYQAKVPTGQDSALGEELRIDRAYVEGVIDELEVLGSRVGVILWRKWRPEEGDAIDDMLSGQTFELLSTDRSLAAQHLGNTAASLGATEVSRQIAQVNAWIAMRQQGGTDAIREAVSAWDTSALEDIFKAARAVLLEEDEFYVIAGPLVESGRLTLTMLDSWPLFAPIREHPRFTELRKKVAPEQNQADGSHGAPIAPGGAEPGPGATAEDAPTTPDDRGPPRKLNDAPEG